MTLWLCGLGGFFVAQFVKTIWPVPLPAGDYGPGIFKITAALAGSFVIAYFSSRHHDLLGFSLAGAGLAGVINKVTRLCSIFGDWGIHTSMEVVRRQTRRPN